MSKFKSKQELLDEIVREREKLETLLETIPDEEKTNEIVDGMSIKDFLAHRTEWGRMITKWISEAQKGERPFVPHKNYKWNQLKELNADIHDRFKDAPLKKVENDFKRVHNKLFKTVSSLTEEELFQKKYYNFTGVSDLATYVNSATASHYRSAHRRINKWWKKTLT